MIGMKVDCFKLEKVFNEAKILKNHPEDMALAMTHFYLSEEGLETETGYKVPSAELKEMIKKNEQIVYNVMNRGEKFLETCKKIYGGMNV